MGVSRSRFRTTSPYRVRVLAWLEAAILTIYGLVLTVAGLLVQSGVIAPAASADRRALAWHAYLWDPWFLIWGAFATLALMRARRRGPVHVGEADSGHGGAVTAAPGTRQAGSRL